MLKAFKPQISICVCHHVGDFIYGFIDSVKRSTGVTYEIIVMTSDEKLAETGIKDCWVHYNTGMPAEKRNTGVRLAKAGYVAFFDDDVEIDPDCLYHLFYAVNETPTGMVYGKLFKADEPHRFDEAGGFLTSTGFIWSRAGQNIIDEGQFDSHAPIFAGKSASCIIRKSVFNKVGGFDEDFGILGEESDLSWRVWLYGYKVMFNPYARGIHYFNTKFKDPKVYYTNERVYRNGCRNYLTMLFKNLETKNLWKILPIHLAIWFGASGAMLLTGKWKQSLNILRGITEFTMRFTRNLSKRHLIQERRVKSDDEIWPSIYRKTPRGYYWERLFRYITGSTHG